MGKPSSEWKVKKRLTLDDFLDTGYGQSKREARADFRHYIKTGQIR